MKLNIGLMLEVMVLASLTAVGIEVESRQGPFPLPVRSARTQMAMAKSASPVLPPTKAKVLSKFSEHVTPAGWHRIAMQWNYAPGWETNGISFNVREFPDNDNKRDLFSLHICTNVAALSVEMHAHPGLWRGITATNRFTGKESTEGIAPVSQIVYEEAGGR